MRSIQLLSLKLCARRQFHRFIVGRGFHKMVFLFGWRNRVEIPGGSWTCQFTASLHGSMGLLSPVSLQEVES